MGQTPQTYEHLFWGYAVIWGCFAVYLALLLRSYRNMAAELSALREQLPHLTNRPAEK